MRYNISHRVTNPWRFISGFYALARWSRDAQPLSKEAKTRLQWFDYHRKHRNVALTCRHFGIARKTFYVWQKRYDPYRLSSLEGRSMAPKRKRQRTIAPEQEARIVALRRQYIRYGKIKLAKIYETIYGEPVSSWHIQKVIERKQLYYHPRKAARIARKRRNAIKRKRITELKKREIRGFLVCLDTIVIYWNGMKRYVFTAIDYYSKIAFARMYPSKASVHAKDFLLRLHLLLDEQIEAIAHDNGSEFLKHFARQCAALRIPQYFSRPKTPKDNAVNERFNRTLEDEFIALGNFTSDTAVFNRRLTDWLVEYNFRRPHQALGYVAPINFEVKYLNVLPRYPSYTGS